MKKIICNYCGTKNNIKRSNCYMCGKKLEHNEQNINENIITGNNKKIICSYCGNVNNINREYCFLCGKKLQSNNITKNKINNENKEKDNNEDYDIKIYNLDDKIDNQINKDVNNKKRRISIITIIFIVAIAFIFSLCIYNFFKIDIEDVKDSVVMLVIYDDNNNEIATGSGFCVFKDDIIATNFHVIEGAYKIKIITDENKNYYANDILIFNKDKDLALIKANIKLKPLNISENNNLKAGQKVTAIGSPAGELNTVSNGIISNADDDFEIRITAPISHGSSGGVLLDEKNRVIGITYSGYDPNYAQNLNYAINVKYLSDIYRNYTENNFKKIDSNNYKLYIGNINQIEKLGIENNKNYNINDISTMFNLTNTRKRFEELLINTNWYNIYNNLNESQKQEVIDLIELMNNYNFNFEYSSSDISGWSPMDFFINLKFLEKYQFAIAYIKLSHNKSSTDEINTVREMPLSIELKMLVIQLMGSNGINFIKGDSGRQICDFIKNSCSKSRDKILEYLGYKIVYNSDNTFTIYWEK